MKAILVDDEQPILDELRYYLGKYEDVEVLAAFTRPLLAVEYVKDTINGGLALPDVVFMDIEMQEINGLGTAREIRALHPDIIVVFVTGYSSYALKSFQVHPLDYLLKPLQEAQFQSTIQYIRKQIGLLQARPRELKKPVYIKCFGHFQISLPGAQAGINWGTRRVKELFQYLIDCGEIAATHEDLLNAVFGSSDKKHSGNLYVTIYKLRRLLNHIDPEGKYLRINNDLILEITPGICDYADFIKFARQNMVINTRNAQAASAVLRQCCGPYLPDVDYPWAYQTANMVEIEYERIALGLAAVYISTASYQDAEKLLLNLIARNPLSEEGFTTLLDLYITNEQHHDFLLVYEQYTRMLKTELDEKPPAKYSLHYKNLLPR